MEAIASRLEAVAIRMEPIASRMEAIAIRNKENKQGISDRTQAFRLR